MKYAETLLKDDNLIKAFLAKSKYMVNNALECYHVVGEYIYFKPYSESDRHFLARIKRTDLGQYGLFIDNFGVYSRNGQNDRMSRHLRAFGVAIFGAEYLNEVLQELPSNFNEEKTIWKSFLIKLKMPRVFLKCQTLITYL